MGAVKKYEMERVEAELARLDEEWEKQNPSLVAEGWDREDYEAFGWA